MHERQLQTEGGGLTMNAVTAADTGGPLILPGPSSNDRQQGFHIADEQVGALHHLNGKGGVDDVGAGQTEVQPSAGRVVDALGHGGGEGDDIVVEHLFQLALPGRQSGGVAFPGLATLLDFQKVFFRHHALGHQRFTGKFLNIEPKAQLVLFGPDRPHLGP